MGRYKGERRRQRKGGEKDHSVLSPRPNLRSGVLLSWKQRERWRTGKGEKRKQTGKNYHLITGYPRHL